MDPSTPISSPTYRIFRDKHGIPQFEPKRGTQALKDALIYAFPTLETELQLMQAALRKFFDSERGSTFVFELPERDLQTSLAKKRDVPISPVQAGKASLRNWKVSRASRTPSRPSSRASSRAPSRASSRAETPVPFGELIVPVSGGGTMSTWMLSNGQELEKRKRQPYDAAKRRKVAENRGNACEKHRASKTACDPNECPQNKLFGKGSEEPRRGSVTAVEKAHPKSISTSQEPKTIETSPSMTSIPTELEDVIFHLESGTLPATTHLSESNSEPTMMDFDYPSADTVSSTWTENTNTSDVSWSSCNIYPPIHETSEISIEEMAQSMIDSTVMDEQSVFTKSFDVGVKEIQDDVQSQLIHQSPSDDPFSFPTQETVMECTLHQPSEVHIQSSEDPFMGWASKRASHLFDDYGWVLSHVETL